MIKQGEIYWIDKESSEKIGFLGLTGARPVIVISTDYINEHSNNILCIPLTTFAFLPNNPYIIKVEEGEGGLIKTSYVYAWNFSSVRKSFLGEKIGSVKTDTLNLIKELWVKQGRRFFLRI